MQVASMDYALINEKDLMTDVTMIYEQPMIDVPSMGSVKPDPDWSAVDPSGHFHAFGYDPFGDDQYTLPTLDKHVKIIHENDPDDGPWDRQKITYRCKICQHKIKPQYIPDHAGMYAKIPGPASWRLEIVAVGPNSVEINDLHRQKVMFRGGYQHTELFGVGMINRTNIEWRGSSDPHEGSSFYRWSGRLDGMGPLGRREI